MDSMIYFGGQVKALDDKGRVGGIGIRFDTTDLSGERFTAKTYLGPKDGDGQECIFHHGMPLKAEIKGLADHTFAAAKAKREDVGIFVETCLDLSDEYEKAVFQLAKKGKLGWSSGAAGHRVVKNADGEIVRWPVAEWSLTCQPCEPQNYGTILPIKSFDAIKFVSVTEGDEDEPETPAIIPDKPSGLAAKLKQHITDLADDKGRTEGAIFRQMAKEAGMDSVKLSGILEGRTSPTDANLKAFARVLSVDFETLKSVTRRDHLQTIKGMFEDALAETRPSRWELESVYCRIIKKLAAAASAAQLAGVTFDLKAKVAEATSEYTALLQSHALAQIAEWVEAGGDDEFYFKAIIDTEASVKALASADLDTHSQLAVSALRGLVARLRANYEARVKVGRPISDRNRNRITSNLDQIESSVSDLRQLLQDTQPMATEAQKLAAKFLTLRNRWRAKQLGVELNG